MTWAISTVRVSSNRSLCSALHRSCGALLLTLMLLAALGLAGCGRAERAAGTTHDDYLVTFSTEPATPVIGMGTVRVTIADRNGAPVDGARVALEGNMSHAGMKPEHAEIATSTSGVYTGSLNWSMAGSWYVDAEITLPGSGEVIRRRFPVEVR